MKKFIEAVDVLLTAWEGYQDDKEGFWEAFDGLKASQPAKPLSKSSYLVHAKVIDLLNEAESYDGRAAEMLGAEPHDQFWTALLEVERARQTKQEEPAKPESVKLLTDQGVPPGQICLMWGFVDTQGRVELHRYEQELSKPGSVVTKDYVWPSLLKYRKQLERDYSGYKRAFAATVAPKPKRGPCPETPRELCEQGVSVDQAALMLGMEKADVELLYQKFEGEGIEPKTIGVTTKDGAPMADYNPTTNVPVDTGRPLTADEMASNEYAELSRDDLIELCEASELPTEGSDNELRQRLAANDAAVMEAL